MIKKKAGWLLVALGIAFGLFVGVWTVFLTMLDPGPGNLNPVETAVTDAQPSQPGVPATLEVQLFGANLCSRTAPGPDAFELEVTMLNLVWPAAIVLVASLCGAWVGWLIKGRMWLRSELQTLNRQT